MKILNNLWQQFCPATVNTLGHNGQRFHYSRAYSYYSSPSAQEKKRDGPLVHREIYFKPKNSKATLPAQRTCPVAFMADAQVDVMNSEPGRR
jgi:hypothetical protein